MLLLFVVKQSKDDDEEEKKRRPWVISNFLFICLVIAIDYYYCYYFETLKKKKGKFIYKNFKLNNCAWSTLNKNKRDAKESETNDFVFFVVIKPNKENLSLKYFDNHINCCVPV